jgi:hypothetical protein
MAPLVVVQNNYVNRLTEPVAKAAHELGLTLHDLSSGDMSKVKAVPDGGPWGPILVMGSIVFVDEWARTHPDLSQWIFWDDSHYDAALWSEMLGDHYLNADGHTSAVGEFLTSGLGEHHIRPRSGIKLIGDKIPDENTTGKAAVPGLVATPESLKAFNIDPTIKIWVSPVKHIYGEVRVWVIDGIPVCASMYRLNGKHHITTQHEAVVLALYKAEYYHSIWYPDKHYVVDLAMTSTSMQIVEYNPIHAAGWYAADPSIVIDTYIQAEQKSRRISYV